MNYKIYFMEFSTPVHFGQGDLWDTGYHLYADTLFSALCKEAIKFKSEKTIENLVKWVREDRLILSDCMPRLGNELWIPKPMMRVQTEEQGDSIIKKSFKKLSHIPLEQIDAYLSGELDPVKENEKLSKLGKSHIFTKAALREKENDALPYDVGTFVFSKNNGLYFIAGFDGEKEERLFNTLIKALSYTGVGGKVSAGFGKFKVGQKTMPEEMAKHFYQKGITQITLSVGMAKEEELESALEGASYKLLKRSGFISSNTYAQTPRRKRDMYLFQAGSCFKEPFVGDVYDVSEDGGHPVYRYAKPLFWGV